MLNGKKSIIIFFFCVSGSEKVFECDLVIIAMGFLGPEKNILTELSLKLDNRGNCETPKDKYSTNIPKVYAAGGKNLGSLFL